ncbi:hypothetical protein D9M72_341000 [compost metagenome]
MREHRRDLEGTDHAAARDLRGLLAGDVDAVEKDGAGGRLQELGEQVEASGLARAVGSNQCMDRPASHPQVDVAHCCEPLELLAKHSCFQDPLRSNCILWVRAFMWINSI